MKATVRIINGKRYNTETAITVAGYDNGLGRSDFHYVYEDLYRTPKGAWFLVGEGGALTKYAQPCGNNATCGGSEWAVFDEDEAFEWLQRHGKTEALEKYFSARIEEA